MDLREAAFVRYFSDGVREQAEQIDRGRARLDVPGAGPDEALEFRLDPDGVWRLHWWSVFARNIS